jgi:hypothetical protein
MASYFGNGQNRIEPRTSRLLWPECVSSLPPREQNVDEFKFVPVFLPRSKKFGAAKYR